MVHQAEGERNFHIFYQLLAGGVAKQHGMDSNPKSYRYLNQGAAERVGGMNDSTWYQEMVQGMSSFAEPPEQQEIFSILVGCLDRKKRKRTRRIEMKKEGSRRTGKEEHNKKKKKKEEEVENLSKAC